jgi:hypothetical protein
VDLISLQKVGNSVEAQSLEYQMVGITHIEKLISKVVNITPQDFITQSIEVLG